MEEVNKCDKIHIPAKKTRSKWTRCNQNYAGGL